jgi:hypothetical protein
LRNDDDLCQKITIPRAPTPNTLRFFVWPPANGQIELPHVSTAQASRPHFQFARSKDLSGLRALQEETTNIKHFILVCQEDEPRTDLNGIEILPWKTFLNRLWEGDYR